MARSRTTPEPTAAELAEPTPERHQVPHWGRPDQGSAKHVRTWRLRRPQMLRESLSPRRQRHIEKGGSRLKLQSLLRPRRLKRSTLSRRSVCNDLVRLLDLDGARILVLLRPRRRLPKRRSILSRRSVCIDLVRLLDGARRLCARPLAGVRLLDAVQLRSGPGNIMILGEPVCCPWSRCIATTKH